QNGFDDGLNNQNNSDNASYKIGNQAVNAAKIGLAEAESGNKNSQSTISDLNSYNEAQTAYNDASASIATNPDDTSVTQTNKSAA
ncbi:hypothetical protein ACKXGD_17945, partial [Enterococcus lactis]